MVSLYTQVWHNCLYCSSKQKNLYDETFRDLVQAVLDGFNGTIFAYGQTGTGKTFTMQGGKLLLLPCVWLKISGRLIHLKLFFFFIVFLAVFFSTGFFELLWINHFYDNETLNIPFYKNETSNIPFL